MNRLNYPADTSMHESVIKGMIALKLSVADRLILTYEEISDIA